MKFYLLVAALWIFCGGETLISLLVYRSLEDTYINKGYLIPQISALVISWPYWILAVPVPWTLWCIGKKNGVEHFGIFAGTIVITATSTFFIVLIGWLLPFLHFH